MNGRGLATRGAVGITTLFLNGPVPVPSIDTYWTVRVPRRMVLTAGGAGGGLCLTVARHMVRPATAATRR